MVIYYQAVREVMLIIPLLNLEYLFQGSCLDSAFLRGVDRVKMLAKAFENNVSFPRAYHPTKLRRNRHLQLYTVQFISSI